MSKRFLIIDGSSMLSTSYYGNLPKSIVFAKSDEDKMKHYDEILQTSDGRYTNAMYVMVRSMFRLLQFVRPDYFAVAFDMSRNTFRRTELGADFYKANRSETASPLKSQFVQMEDFLEQIGVRVLYGPNYEADDYIASIVSKFEHEDDLQIIVHSKDHDFMQLVAENVELWRPMRQTNIDDMLLKHWITKDSVVFNNLVVYTSDVVKFDAGVYPSQIVDLLSLEGDVGDGIPGCKGVSSAAAPLVSYYGSVNALYDAIYSCDGDKKKEKELVDLWKTQLGIKRSPLNALKNNRDMVFLSKNLAQMKRDIVQIPQDLQDYEFSICLPALMSLLQNYEMKSLYSYCETIVESF